MIKIPNVGRWTRLEKSLEQKPNVLLSLFSLLSIFLVLIQAINDILIGISLTLIFDAFIIGVLVIVYVLNEKRYHTQSKILFLGWANLSIFVYASLIPKESGIFFLFFPIIGITSLIFHHHQAHLRNFFIVLPILLVALLELTDYQIFGPVNIQEDFEDNTTYFINLFVGLIMLVIAIVYMTKISHEIELKRLKISDELSDINLDLKKANIELDHFVYSTSHDLKAPLSSILGLINIAKKESPNGNNEYYDMIEERVAKLNLFIKEIIDLSRNARLDLKHDEIALDELVNAVVDNYKYMDEAASIRFDQNVLVDQIIKSDKARLEVVLNNLVANAIKYHRPEIDDQYIEIKAEKIHNSLFVSVKDNGQGIDPDRIDQIFDMFYRGHEDSQGSGLGLYIVQEVITKMNGNIELKSEPGKGTEMNLVFPLK